MGLLSRHFPRSFFILSMTSRPDDTTSLARASSSSPVVGSISRFLFLASASSSGSLTAFEKASPQARIFIAGRVNELKMEIARLEGAHRELRARGKDVRVIEASIRQLQREAKDLKR